MPYPRRTLFLSLAIALAIGAATAATSGVPSPALSLSFFSPGAGCDDLVAANPGSPNPCRYDVTERDCGDSVDNDSDEETDCLDADCVSAPECDTTACSGSNVCDTACPEYDLCACDPTALGCGDGGGGACSGSNVCDTACPEYDLCACDPTDPSCQTASEDCGNGVDDDGDGAADCADADCADDCAVDYCDDSTACNYGQGESCTYCECDGLDNDDDGETDEAGESCAAPPTVSCIVIGVSGINADSSFDSAVQSEIAKSSGRATFVSMGGTEDADAKGASLEATLRSYYENANENERILVAAHSLGAIATFNMRQDYGGSYSDTTFLLYDAPYNYPGSDNPTRWFSGTLRAIKRARDGGVAGTLAADWTGGLDQPNDPTEQANHEKFKTAGSSVLVGIKGWVDGCPKK